MSSPSNTAKEQGHVRQGSSGRGATQMPRRSTRGPLDFAELVEEPLLHNATLTSSSASVTNHLPTSAATASSPQTPRPTSLVSYHPSSSSVENISQQPAMPSSLPIHTTSKSPARATPPKSFPNLLRPENFHPLPSTSIPPALLNVTASSDLPHLLSSSQFRNAAIIAAHKLSTDTAPDDVALIFELLYIRLACLTLVGKTDMAAQEVKVLGDFNEAAYMDEVIGRNIVPWELRVLAVRLQGIGFGDLRKGVMGYYELAREARADMLELSQGGGGGNKSTDVAVWRERLRDLGVRVASALVEMGDLSGAAAHLRTLGGEYGQKEAGYRGALLWLKIGDVERARAVVASGDEAKGEDHLVITALANMAEGKYKEAADAWRVMLDGGDQDRKREGEEMWRVNLAVCLLYSGQIGEARDIMEFTISSGTAFHALTFNLSTVYELSSDRSRVLKTQLVDRVAGLPNARPFTNADFKL